MELQAPAFGEEDSRALTYIDKVSGGCGVDRPRLIAILPACSGTPRPHPTPPNPIFYPIIFYLTLLIQSSAEFCYPP